MKSIYLDHNSTSPLRPEVRETWLKVQDSLPGNASSLHSAGRRARQTIDEARERVAAALGVREEELFFTSGGTEGNNLALIGPLRARPGAGLVTTGIEHSSVLGAAEALEREGHPVRRLEVDGCGRLDVQALQLAARAPGTALISVAAANNEIGTLAPMGEIGAALDALDPEVRPLFHTDAVQALGKIPVDLRSWGVDLASFSAHKLGGPIGTGVLFRRTPVELAPLAYGGGQEGGLHPGTENVAGIAAAAHAIELAVSEQAGYLRHTSGLTQLLWRELQRKLPRVETVGCEPGSPQRLPNTLNLCAPSQDGKVLITRLDLEGLSVSAGSACSSGALEPSHVLLALGFEQDRARACLRLSVGRDTTEDECKGAVDILEKVLGSSRTTRAESTPL